MGLNALSVDLEDYFQVSNFVGVIDGDESADLPSRVGAGEPIVLYVHPWEIDPSQPRQQAGWKVRVNHYHNLKRTEGQLAGLLNEFRFQPLETVLGELELETGLPGYRFGR